MGTGSRNARHLLHRAVKRVPYRVADGQDGVSDVTVPRCRLHSTNQGGRKVAPLQRRRRCYVIFR